MGRTPGGGGQGLLAALLATSFVVLAPVAFAFAFENAVFHLPLPLPLFVVVSAGASLVIASAAAAVWSRHSATGDRVFGDLMLWGWIRRSRADRRIANARSLLESGHEMPSDRRVELLWSIARTVESRDPRLHGHSRRVARIAEAIALKLGLEPDEVARIRTAAAIHDVGKLRTPTRIINKPARLTDAEFEMIKLHPEEGARMVAALADDQLTAIVRHHHERLDGRGYPAGLRGDVIPLGARVIAVADTFDAITSTRPYRRGACHREALDVLRQEAGTQLDPRVVSAFVAYYGSRRTIVGLGAVTAGLSRFAAAVKTIGGAAAGLSVGQGVAIVGAVAVVASAAVSPVVSQAMPGGGHRAERSRSHHSTSARQTATAVDRREALALEAGTSGSDDATTGDEEAANQNENSRQTDSADATAQSSRDASSSDSQTNQSVNKDQNSNAGGNKPAKPPPAAAGGQGNSGSANGGGNGQNGGKPGNAGSGKPENAGTGKPENAGAGKPEHSGSGKPQPAPEGPADPPAKPPADPPANGQNSQNPAGAGPNKNPPKSSPPPKS